MKKGASWTYDTPSFFCMSGRSTMLRRDVISAGSWPVSDCVSRAIISRRYP